MILLDNESILSTVYHAARDMYDSSIRLPDNFFSIFSFSFVGSAPFICLRSYDVFWRPTSSLHQIVRSFIPINFSTCTHIFVIHHPSQFLVTQIVQLPTHINVTCNDHLKLAFIEADPMEPQNFPDSFRYVDSSLSIHLSYSSPFAQVFLSSPLSFRLLFHFLILPGLLFEIFLRPRLQIEDCVLVGNLEYLAATLLSSSPTNTIEMGRLGVLLLSLLIFWGTLNF